MNDDTISRQAAIDAFRKELCRERVYATPFISFKGCERILNELPSAERHGRWMDYRRMGIDGTFHWFRQCSECLYEREDDNEDKDTPYCPNCGAKMDLERSDRMTTNDGYTIIQYPTKNAIVITLPQRWDSLTNTFVPVSDRRKCLSDTEEAALLATVKAMFENGARMDGDVE